MLMARVWRYSSATQFAIVDDLVVSSPGLAKGLVGVICRYGLLRTTRVRSSACVEHEERLEFK
jgi:hypothetical protein